MVRINKLYTIRNENLRATRICKFFLKIFKLFIDYPHSSFMRNTCNMQAVKMKFNIQIDLRINLFQHVKDIPEFVSLIKHFRIYDITRNFVLRSIIFGHDASHSSFQDANDVQFLITSSIFNVLIT